MSNFRVDDRIMWNDGEREHEGYGTVGRVALERHGDGKDYEVVRVRWDSGYTGFVYPVSIRKVPGAQPNRGAFGLKDSPGDVN